MAYARFGEDSDVYVFRTDTLGPYSCCHPGDVGSFHTEVPELLLVHLHEHEMNGDKVPFDHIRLRLQQEHGRSMNWSLAQSISCVVEGELGDADVEVSAKKMWDLFQRLYDMGYEAHQSEIASQYSGDDA